MSRIILTWYAVRFQRDMKSEITLFSHPELLNASKQTVLSEICDASNAVKNACGETPIYFRPPQGRCRDEVIAAAEEAEMTIILWSIDTRDWAGNSVDHIVEEVMNVVQRGYHFVS